MFQKARDTFSQDSESLLVVMLKWRKPLAICVLIGSLLSFIFSGPAFITPKFKSSVIFFPTSNNSISKAIMDDNSSDKQDILAFGAEEEAEQMLQILNSDEIRDCIIKKYNLLEHYRISPSEEFPQTKLNEILHENIHFSRTEFMSVRIDVLDENAQMAADIANDIAAFCDSIKSRMQGSRAFEAQLIMKEACEEKEMLIKKLEDSLQYIRQKGVMDFRSQTQIVNNEYMSAVATLANEKAALLVLEKYLPAADSNVIKTKARINGAEARKKELSSEIENLAHYGGASMALSEELLYEREELSKMEKQYDKLVMDAGQKLSQKFLVNKAVKAERKAYPIRWLIVLVATASSFLIALMVILSIDKYKQIRYNL